MADISLHGIVKVYGTPAKKKRFRVRKAKAAQPPKRAVDGVTLTIPHGFAFRQLPRVKSGMGCGFEPLRSDVSVSSQRQLVAARS